MRQHRQNRHGRLNGNGRMTNNLFEAAFECIMCNIPENKRALTVSYAELWASGNLDLSSISAPVEITQPGRPLKPELVAPEQLPKRGMGSLQGRIILMHAIAHIEFNAINLAWDAVYRFRNFPPEYYSDWIRVASEEAQHFSMINNYLNKHNCHYGDYPAHDGLWIMAHKTAHDPLIRMALIPRVFEAKGLDVTPDMIKRFAQHNASDAAKILQTIYKEEIGHVDIGSKWFRYLCRQNNISPDQTFQKILEEYQAVIGKNRLNKNNLNREARLQAGFSESEISMIENMV